MDIFFDVQVSVSRPPVFSLSFDPETMSLQCIGDMASFTVQANMKRLSEGWPGLNKSCYPVLFSLSGILYGSSLFRGEQGIGASLASIEEFPLTFPTENSQLIHLSFRCSRLYLQLVEEQRASNPSSNLNLSISFWATTSLVETTSQGTSYKGELTRIKSRQGGSVNISRSHWQDMLASIEYPQRRYIQLPTLAVQEGTDELRRAVGHLNEAHMLFAQDRYREAVQRCRQARDVLLGEDKSTWAEKVLAPIILAEKAMMIDEGVKALNRMGNVASHGEGIEVDRDTAIYVIGSLTLILDYINRKLK